MIFPKRCPVCRCICDKDEFLICRYCVNKIKLIRPPYCKLCGKALYNANQEYCERCCKTKWYFDKCFALMEYDDITKKIIHDIKYSNKRYYMDLFIHLTNLYLGDKIRSLKADAFIAVPLSKKRLKKRGFNQAALYARGLSDLTGIEFIDDLIFRKKDTKPQNKLSPEERGENIRDAFVCNNMNGLKSVIIVDDIFTTGSTLNECAKVLKKSGIINVYCVCISIATD